MNRSFGDSNLLFSKTDLILASVELGIVNFNTFTLFKTIFPLTV